jgi:hypothetical protein
MVRVLKPGGLLLVTVPAGERYLEQQRMGVAGAVRKTDDKRCYFFQRIYDPASIHKLLSQESDLEGVAIDTVGRRFAPVIKVWAFLGENLRGILGFLNPLLSMLLNKSEAGIQPLGMGNYSDVYTDSDIYGDWLIAATKKSICDGNGCPITTSATFASAE